ncbi:MAG: argininosuccinate lyase [Spirochaetaceae bacterium]|nr:argininosuccinate lyase [Spirochaetaceae bacterium]
MAKLWEKDYSTDTLIEEFTVGRDYRLDMNLIPSDCIASMAHARMLNSIGILSDDDYSQLKKGLISIIKEHKKGNFVIKLSDEDGHTAIENRLSELCGDPGKRIHTGRSRNDQVVTSVRVFSRSMLLEILEAGFKLAQGLLTFAEKNKDIPMAGRTHMQTAMPSSVGLWAGAFAEELADDLKMVFNALSLINQNPLGAAAGYGVPLPLNREMTAELMGFPAVQNNVIYVNNSRGKFESVILDSLDQIGLTLSKMAQDLILFSLPEFGYFKLPDELCTGSSIMPQKKNPDGLELTRSASAVISAASTEVKNIIRSLPSGYNRDFQSAKEPFIRGNRMALMILKVMDLTIGKLQVNEEKLIAGFTADIHATDAALEMVAAGSTFREAYKEVGLNLDKLGERDPYNAIKSRTHSGSTGNPRFEICAQTLKKLQEDTEEISTAVNSAVRNLTGEDIEIILPRDYR